MGPGQAYGNGVARGQLKNLHDDIRKTTIGMMRKVDPAVAKVYQRMQKQQPHLDLDSRYIFNRDLNIVSVFYQTLQYTRYGLLEWGRLNFNPP